MCLEQNYGAKFDVARAGLPGPIEIVGVRGDETVIKDLSNHKWSYQKGLKGFDDELFRGDAGKWRSDELPINRRMTWYKVWI